MVRLLLDENIRAESIWNAVGATMESFPFDIIRVGDHNGPPLGIDDAHLLEWAAVEQRLLISYDKRTLPQHLHDHVSSGGHSPGIVFMSKRLSPVELAEYFLLIATSSTPNEWADTYRFIP